MIPAHTVVDGLQPCGLPPCPEHVALCAYHGDEPDRCPMCHSRWSVILDRIARGAGEHSCETARNGTDRASGRPARALQLRQDASGKPQEAAQSLHCPHRVADIGRVRYGAPPASQSFSVA